MRVTRVLERADLTVVAVERLVLRHARSGAGCLLQGEVEPVAVVVCSGRHAYALDMEAQALDIEQLKRNLPELDAMLRQDTR